jgi:hypothetical protein
VLAAEEDALEVGGVHVPPGAERRILGVLGDRPVFEAGDARVVDEHIEAAVLFEQLSHHLRPEPFGAHVE